MKNRHLFPSALGFAALLCCASIQPAQADIYTYTDDEGVLHISNVRQNGQYKLYLRTPKAQAKPAMNRIRGGYHMPSLARRAQYEQMVDDASRTYQVDKALVHAVISAESGYNPNAISPKGARGLMQLMPATAARYGAMNLMDPWENIQAGTRYLKDLLRMFNNDMQLAVAAYNAGEGAVQKYGYKIPPYAETTHYVPKVLNFYERYRASM